MGIATPPNQNAHPPGHSSMPVAPIQGRGAMPTGDRFSIASQPMAQPPSAVSNVAPTVVPVGPPDRVEATDFLRRSR